MNGSKKYYKDIDFIRVISCIAILMYHLNILKGGYLAVCTFFVLSGYLSCISLFRKEKVCLKKYYLNRLLKIYLPLIIVVFISICVVSFFPTMKWLNLKPETTSVLLGYNNFWQLNANLDYFARHVNSPFIHLWYIAILLQFDLIFPFIFIILKNIGDKINKLLPSIITIILSVIFAIYFYKMSLTDNIMVTYYSTFTRIFSLLFGVTLGFIHSYYKAIIPKLLKNKYINKVLFYLYILVLICLFIFVDAKSIYFPISMILVTLISCRLIDYGTINVKINLSVIDKLISSISNVSYEIYLIQYPVIFLMQYTNINEHIKIILIIIITIVLSYILKFSINLKNIKYKMLRYNMFSIICLLTLYGGYKYICAEDYTKEMKQLEEQLEQNQQIIQKKQEEYKLQLEQEEQNYQQLLNDLENGEQALEEVVTNLSVVGIGDSVMLGAVEDLYNKFPNGYFDAQISRTAWVAHGILSNLKNNNILGDPVVINLGANGDCSRECKIEIIELCEDRNIFWLNVTNDNEVNVNDELLSLSNEYHNLNIIDWNAISKGHTEYFIADGIHLTQLGREVYTNTIYNSIYEVYLQEYKTKKEELINEHEQKRKDQIIFYGNGILLNVYEEIQETFSSAKFIINKEFNYESIKKEIENNISTNKMIFIFDKLSNLDLIDYKNLIELCHDKELYVFIADKNIFNELINLESDKMKIVNLYEKIYSNNIYLMPDEIHLNEQGNKLLGQIIKESIKK